jgi:Chemotaxis protein; stimulates methylation of MCP proteins
MNGGENPVTPVGIGEYRIAHNPTILRAMGLGSCVGVFLFDEKIKVSGLAHILLPDSPNDPKKRSSKYADVALREMIREMEEKGCKRENLKAKIVGGAQMFDFMDNEMLKIGERNIRSVRSILDDENIPTIAEDVGENYGRTMEAYTSDGRVHVRCGTKGEKWI